MIYNKNPIPFSWTFSTCDSILPGHLWQHFAWSNLITIMLNIPCHGCPWSSVFSRSEWIVTFMLQMYILPNFLLFSWLQTLLQVYLTSDLTSFKILQQRTWIFFHLWEPWLLSTIYELMGIWVFHLPNIHSMHNNLFTWSTHFHQ